MVTQQPVVSRGLSVLYLAVFLAPATDGGLCQRRSWLPLLWASKSPGWRVGCWWAQPPLGFSAVSQATWRNSPWDQQLQPHPLPKDIDKHLWTASPPQQAGDLPPAAFAPGCSARPCCFSEKPWLMGEKPANGLQTQGCGGVSDALRET